MLVQGQRVRIKDTSRAHNRLRGMVGTLIRKEGYGEWLVTFDDPHPSLTRQSFIWVWDNVTNRRERVDIHNFKYVSERSMVPIQVDIGDLEDDL